MHDFRPIYSLSGEDEGVHEEDEEHVQNLESLTEDGKNRKINVSYYQGDMFIIQEIEKQHYTTTSI